MFARVEQRAVAVGAGPVAGRDQVSERVVHPLQVLDPALQVGTAVLGLLGAQLVGHLPAQISKRVDILATTMFYVGTVDEIPDLDLSYTPPLGSPYDAIQNAALAWLDTQRH